MSKTSSGCIARINGAVIVVVRRSHVVAGDNGCATGRRGAVAQRRDATVNFDFVDGVRTRVRVVGLRLGGDGRHRLLACDLVDGP